MYPRSSRFTEEIYALTLDDGLYLLIRRSGSPARRFEYHFQGREKLISFGAYPQVSLNSARDQRDAAGRIVAAGGDPSVQRQAEKTNEANSFEGQLATLKDSLP